MKSTSVEEILAERKKTHGSFEKHAYITQTLKVFIQAHADRLSDTQLESLEMIAHKIGRILAGDPNHIDHWDDIAGYATLISNNLRSVKVMEDYTETHE